MVQIMDFGMEKSCQRPKMQVAMGYVPYQPWGPIYEPDVALSRATLFPDLDKPFIGKEALLRDRT